MTSLCRGLLVVGARLSPTPRFLLAASPYYSFSFSINSLNQRFLESKSIHYCHHRSLNKRLLLRLPLTSSSSIMSQMESSAGVSTKASFDNGGDTTVFPLSSSSVLKINKGDITKWFVDGSSDAIVNPANERMLGGGGADGAIHRAAGPELLDACYKVPEVQPGIRCPTGEARITPGFKLPASHVIYTVGPIYDTDSNPAASLKNAYSLTVAKDNNIKYIAFPAISCGVYGYPYEEAAAVSISTIKEFKDDLKEVHFVLFSDDIYNVWLKKAKELLLP
ncbi:macro domain-containing protein VPA0103 isoform X2 [Jatropha curcas]|uniref:macro domain-containing protein VPA0103 isoform X2 n=1 Tax=Jatropha curcas TaxID=180498 RepID=UPI0005FABBB9|nr:macro domain-containing protein VPA0103 isoform X2 [Jatropha curcas]